MEISIGLWIDHRKTVVVTVKGKKQETMTIKSNVEKQPRRQEGKSTGAPDGTRMNPADDIRERGFTEHLHGYYEKVVAQIRQADSILVFGPGEAKGELIKLLVKEKLSDRLVGVETADKMTAPQITEKVCQYYQARR